MIKRSSMVNLPILKTYAMYLGMFLAIWLIATAIDWRINPYGAFSVENIFIGALVEALLLGLETAFICTGIIAIILRLLKKEPQYNTVWIVLGAINALRLLGVAADIPQSPIGGSIPTYYYGLAINEQIETSGSFWTALLQDQLLLSLLPLCLAYYLSVRRNSKKDNKV